MIKHKVVSSLVLIGLMTSSALYAADSTSLISPNVKTIKPQNIVNPSQCIAGNKIQAVIVANSGGTGGTKTTQCPDGYVATGLQAYVGMGLGSGVYKWESYCCKSYVGYTS